MSHVDQPHEQPGADQRPGAAEPASGERASAEELRQTEERLLRVQAELENYRKRAQRELDDFRRFREIDLLRDLLPVLDNVQRAIDAASRTADVEGLLSGFRMTAQQVEKVLADHGCKPIPTDGQAFDPAVHDAILEQPAPGTAPGTIVGTAVRGYTLHDRVVRPAQVIVAKGG